MRPLWGLACFIEAPHCDQRGTRRGLERGNLRCSPELLGDSPLLWSRLHEICSNAGLLPRDERARGVVCGARSRVATTCQSCHPGIVRKHLLLGFAQSRAGTRAQPVVSSRCSDSSGATQVFRSSAIASTVRAQRNSPGRHHQDLPFAVAWRGGRLDSFAILRRGSPGGRPALWD